MVQILGNWHADEMEVMIMVRAFIEKLGNVVRQIAIIAVAQGWGFIRNPAKFFRKGYIDGNNVISWKK